MSDLALEARRSSTNSTGNSSRLSISSPLPSDILKDVVAYVEVRTASDNRSAAVERVLERMGATVEEKFTDDVTHVIFKEGKKRTYDRAVKRGVHLVSVLWVDRCRELQARVEERPFLAEGVTTPPPGVRWKKCKSMQPRNFDQEVALSAERCEKRRKRIAHANRFQFEEGATPTHSPGQVLVLETQPRSPFVGIALRSPSSITIPSTPPSMQARIEQLQRQREARKGVGEQLVSPLCRNLDPDLPLQRKLFASQTIIPEKDDIMEDLGPLMKGNKASPLASSRREEKQVSTRQQQLETLSSPTSCSEAKHDALQHTVHETAPNCVSDLPEAAVAKPVPSKRPNRRSARLSMPAGGKLQPVSHSNPPPAAVSSPDAESSQSHKQGCSLPCSAQEESESGAKKRQRTRSNPESVKVLAPNRKRGRKSMGTYLHSKGNSAQVDNKSASASGTFTEGSSASGHLPETKGFVGGNGESSAGRSSQISAVSRDRSRRKSSVIKCQTEKSVLPNHHTVSECESVGASDCPGTGRKRKLLNPSQEMQDFPSPAPKTSLCDLPAESFIKKRGTKRKSCDVNDIFPESSLVPKRSVKSSKSVASSQLEQKKNGKSQELGKRSKQQVKKSLVDERDEKESADKPERDDSVLGSSRTNSFLGASMSMALDESASTSFVRKLAAPRPSIAEFQVKVPRRRSKRQISLPSVPEDDGNLVSREDRHRHKILGQQTSRLAYSKPSLVMTSLHRPEQELVISAVRHLGRFVLEDSVTNHTTHLVCGAARRTLNVLHALARGCWILSKDWVLRSLEAEQWVPEEDFELIEDFPQAKTARQARDDAAPGEYRCRIFEETGSIFVSHDCTPPRSQITTLLRLSGAKVTDTMHRADLHIGDEIHADKTSVKPLWVLDCISQQQLLPLDSYILTDLYDPKVSSSPEF